jgi:hypothetical protein
MADAPQKLIAKLADRGEDAISKVGEVPGATRVSNAVGAMRDRMDELQRRLRGLEDVERRLTALERRVEELAKAKPKTTRSRSTSSTASKPASRKSSPGG